MDLQINMGLQQQLIVLIVSLPLGLHPSPLRPSSFSTRGLCPSPLGPSSFSTWAFSLYLASFRILIIPSFLENICPQMSRIITGFKYHFIPFLVGLLVIAFILLCNLHLHLVIQSFHILNFGLCILMLSLLGLVVVSWPVRQ